MEIERRFLVRELPSLEDCKHYHIRQGYVVVDDTRKAVVRVRSDARYGCVLAIKAGEGLSRDEIEINIDVEEFMRIWPITLGMRVEKERYLVPMETHTAEVDLFGGTLGGLQIVEVEFSSVVDSEAFSPPEWFGLEVTNDSRYINVSLARHGIPSDYQPTQ